MKYRRSITSWLRRSRALNINLAGAYTKHSSRGAVIRKHPRLVVTLFLVAAAIPFIALRGSSAATGNAANGSSPQAPASPQSRTQGNAPSDKFRRAGKPVRDQYIVVLKKDTPSDEVEALTNDLLTRHQGTTRFIYKHAIKGFSIQMPEAAAIALSLEPRVEYVEEDGEVMLATTQQNAPWSLDRIDQRNPFPNFDYSFANVNTGTGVHAYVVDSGIQNTHTEFRNANGSSRVVRDADLVWDWQNGNDCNGHGTLVAGIIGGNTFGVAKGATLHAVRVFGCADWTFSSTIIAGVDWVDHNHQSPAVMNLSLGIPVTPISGVDYGLEDAVRGAIDHGVTVVVAAGNDNLDASLTSPARIPEAITVGATEFGDARASFSNFGPLVDLFAPGANIRSASNTDLNGNGILDDAVVHNFGTSFSAPYVAGVAARFLQVNPGMPPAAVQGAIKNSATPNKVSDPGVGSPNLLLYSEIHAKLARESLVGFISEADTQKDSGMDVGPDEWLALTGGGEIWAGVLLTGNNGPQGWNSIENSPAFPLPGSRPFSLLGILDSQPFYIGRSNAPKNNFSSSKRLFLRTNDDVPGNGSGSFLCHIQVWKKLTDVSANFVSQVVPTILLPGQVFPVSITMQNVGPTTWTAGGSFSLATEPDSLTWGVPRFTVPNDVPPGAEATFMFNATAPFTPGNYNFKWRMVQEGIQRFGDVTTNVPITVLTPSNQAEFVSQTVKTAMYAGESYDVSVTMRNTGNTTWLAGSAYKLGSQNPQDNMTWGLNRRVLTDSVPPGGQVTLNFTVTAPGKAGNYNFQWRMLQEGVEWFGATTPNVVVTVKLPSCPRC